MPSQGNRRCGTFLEQRTAFFHEGGANKKSYRLVLSTTLSTPLIIAARIGCPIEYVQINRTPMMSRLADRVMTIHELQSAESKINLIVLISPLSPPVFSPASSSFPLAYRYNYSPVKKSTPFCRSLF